MLNNKYIIVEIIPTASDPKNGEIIQISALKLDGLKLLDRFDYRLEESYLSIPQMQSLIDYDRGNFNYVADSNKMLNEFKSWSNNLPILILDTIYTSKYLSSISNDLIPILKYLNEEYSTDIIDRLINKYKLEPSNYIVDLLYECLIKELS